jgi:hypothetical protein
LFIVEQNRGKIKMPRYVVYRPHRNVEEAKKELLRVETKASKIEITLYPKKKTRTPGYKMYRISFIMSKIGKKK